MGDGGVTLRFLYRAYTRQLCSHNQHCQTCFVINKLISSSEARLKSHDTLQRVRTGSITLFVCLDGAQPKGTALRPQ